MSDLQKILTEESGHNKTLADKLRQSTDALCHTTTDLFQALANQERKVNMNLKLWIPQEDELPVYLRLRVSSGSKRNSMTLTTLNEDLMLQID